MVSENELKLEDGSDFPEWEEKKLGDVTTIKAGGTPSTDIHQYWGGSIRWMNSGELNLKRIFDVANRITELGLQKSSTHMIPKNCVLVGLAGQGKTRGTVALNYVELCTNQSIAAIFPSKSYISHFLYHNLDNRYQELRMISGNYEGRGGLNLTHLNNLLVYFPCIEEQQKIAQVLSDMDDLIHKTEEVIEKQKNLRQGMMQKIFSQEIRFKQDDGSDFPDWVEKKLGDIGDFKTSSVDKKVKDSEKLVFLVNYMNVYRHEKINKKTIQNYMIVSATNNQIETNNLLRGDILFTPSSETPNDIGHSVVIFEDLENTLYSYHLLRFRPKINIDILYSHYFCNTSDVLNQISQLCSGSTRFTISVKSFSNVKINMPVSLEEQQKIATLLSSLDDQIAKQESTLQKLKNQKQGLMQTLLTGKIRLK